MHTNKVTALGIVLLVLFAAYSPALLFHYAHHDDYFLLNKSGNAVRMESNTATGRFLSTFLMQWFGQYATEIKDLTSIRWAVFLLLSVSAWSLYLFFARFEERKVHALLFSLSLFTLPPFESFVSYSGNSFYAPSIFLGLWAGVLAVSGWDEAREKLKTGTIILAITVFLAALTVYPSGAMLFWAIPAILLTQLKHPLDRKFTIGIVFLVGIVGIGLYGVILKLCRMFIFSDIVYNPFYNPDALTSDYIQKVIWFLEVPLFDSFNLWNIFPNEKWMILVVGTLVSGAVVFILRQKLPSRYLISLVSLFFILLLLSFSPNLIPAANAPWYRCQAGLASIICIFLLWAIRVQLNYFGSPKYVLTIVLFLVVLAGVFMSYRNIFLYRVIPSRQEIAYYKNNLRSAFEEGTKNIHVIQLLLPAKARYDEFVVISSNYRADFFYMIYTVFVEMANEEGWVVENSSFPRSGEMVFQLRQKEENSFKDYSINLTYTPENVPISPPASVTVLKIPYDG